MTIQANAGSYPRVYYEEEHTLLNTRYAFGINYKTQADYTRYRPNICSSSRPRCNTPTEPARARLKNAPAELCFS